LKFDVTSTRNVDGLEVTLSGVLNEHAGEKLKALATDTRQCTFNFRDVTFINSAGAREWILFLTKFTKDHKVILENCPPDILRQMGMIPLFLGDATLKSLFLQHHCESCSQTSQELVQRDTLVPGRMPEKTCKDCGSKMLLDEDVYQFLFRK